MNITQKSKKLIAAAAVATGLVAMLVAPISQADWYHRHHWHRDGRWVVYHGCSRVVSQRFCRVNQYGYRHCYVSHYVRWSC